MVGEVLSTSALQNFCKALDENADPAIGEFLTCSLEFNALETKGLHNLVQ